MKTQLPRHPKCPMWGAVSIGSGLFRLTRTGGVWAFVVWTTRLPRHPGSPNEKVIVVGTSEFVWRPFLLAERWNVLVWTCAVLPLQSPWATPSSTPCRSQITTVLASRTSSTT